MFWEYMLEIVRSIFLDILGGEPMGIIRLENQFIIALYAYAKVWLINYMPVILIGAAIFFVIGTTVFGRTCIYRPRGVFHRVFGTVFRLFTNIIFAWGFLIYGAAVGQIVNHNANEEDDNTHNGEENARITYTRRIHTGPIWNVVHSFTRLSLHFNLGRGIFRLFFYLLGFIPRLRDNTRVRTIIARALTFTVILLGVWKIPLDWTT